MRKTKTIRILEILGSTLMTAADIVTAILESSYGASYSKMDRNYRRFESERLDGINAARERQRFYNLISKLKREGLLEGKQKLKLTRLGREKLKQRGGEGIVKFDKYKSEKDSKTKIFIFDIPEKEKYKRAWVRSSLVQLGFRMLQKSVWVGEVKIPEEFLEDLKFLKIDRYIHIFSGDKLGTIDAE